MDWYAFQTGPDGTLAVNKTAMMTEKVAVVAAAKVMEHCLKTTTIFRLPNENISRHDPEIGPFSLTSGSGPDFQVRSTMEEMALTPWFK